MALELVSLCMLRRVRAALTSACAYVRHVRRRYLWGLLRQFIVHSTANIVLSSNANANRCAPRRAGDGTKFGDFGCALS